MHAKWGVSNMPDEGPGFFKDKHVAIFGLGLMGGSAAMALKGHCRLLTGIDPHPAVIDAALSRGLVDQADVTSGDLVADADFVILAAQVNTILSILSDLPKLCPREAVILDFGSTKKKICDAMRGLPDRFDPIGGHPMCGKETSGLNNADASIFFGAAFVLVQMERTSARATKTVKAFIDLLGSHPIMMDAATHDLQVAAISHVPYLAANALAYSTPVSAAPLAATGFASTTRLALTPPDMMMDVLQTNRDAILDSLNQYRAHLASIENLLNTRDWTGLGSLLTAGAEKRVQIDLSNKGKTV